VRGWVDLCKAEAPVSLEKQAMVKCLRELIPKEIVALRSDDASSAMRMGNHENTSHEDGAKDAPQTVVTFPEFVEMTVRCALGTTPFPSAPGDPEENEDEDEENKNARSFDPAKDGLPFAQMRIRKIWDWLFVGLATELDRNDIKENDGNVLMEDCPAYDEVYSDVQMLFAHYASGEPYSRTLDFTDPDLRLSVTDLLRQCRDSCMLDSRITLTAINDQFAAVTGSDLASGAVLDFFQWQCLLVMLARVKYRELRALDAIRILLRKWLVPMVYVDIPRTELSDFVFTPSIVTLCLTYEQHLARMLERFTTTKELIIGPDGEPQSEVETDDDFKLKVGAGGGDGENAEFLKKLEAERAAATGVSKVTVKVSTLVDLVAFLKCIGFLPELLAVEEVPALFAAVVNASPVQQVPIYQASISVSQVLVILVQGALVAFARPPYSSKYATREEKVMAALELVEVAYLSLFNRYMPLQARPSFPSASLQLQGLTLESELREFLLTRRLQRGLAVSR